MWNVYQRVPFAKMSRTKMENQQPKKRYIIYGWVISNGYATNYQRDPESKNNCPGESSTWCCYMSCFQSVPLVLTQQKFWVGIIGKATGTILWIPKLRSDGGKLHLKPPVVSAGLPAREHQHHLPTIPIIVASLVGGLEHEFYDFPYIGNHNPNWLSYFSEGLKLPTSHHSGFNSHNFRNSCGLQSEFLELQWAAICHSNVVSENRGTKHHLVMFYQFSGQDDFGIHGISYVFHCFPTCSRSKSAFFLSLRWRGLWGFTIQILCSKTGGDAEGVQKGFFLNNQSYN